MDLSLDEALLRSLSEMASHLEACAARLTPEEARRRPASGKFSFLENVWHLADLEREGFGERIRRLLSERDPHLPDFEGDRIARERNYAARDLAEGLSRFRQARGENLRRLSAASAEELARAGTQEGVGRITIADVPRMMAEHDAGHRADIEEILKK